MTHITRSRRLFAANMNSMLFHLRQGRLFSPYLSRFRIPPLMSICLIPRVAFTSTFLYPNHCWNCGSRVDGSEYFCKCGKIQPLNENWSLFDALGYTGGPVVRIDPSELSMRMRRIQKSLHPDKFYNASEYEQQLARDAASFVNNAYSTLLRPVDRFSYILSFYGFEEAEDIGTTDHNGLLSEVMDLNEDIHDIANILKDGESFQDLSLENIVYSVVDRISDSLRKHRHHVVQHLEASRFREAHASLVKYRYYLRLRTQLMELDSALRKRGIHLNFPSE